MRIGLTIILVAVAAAVPRPSEAKPAVAPASLFTPPADGNADIIPVALTAYPSRDAAHWGLPTIREERESGSLRMFGSAEGSPAFAASDGAGATHTSYLPLLFSLLVPGTGEIYLGHYWRGGGLLALEIGAWLGYAHYHNEGLDERAAYEQFADDHWDYDRWIEDHPATEGLTDPTFAELDSIGKYHWDQWPGYHTFYDKETEKQNYYETIGKYDWFISGWEDWDGVSHDTSLRTTYRQMRIESNDDLDKAEKFVYLSIATRIFSLVDTYFLVRNSGKDPEALSRSRSGLSIEAHATGVASGHVALLYRFQ